MFVLLPKGNGDFRGIRLIEVRWKNISGMINHCIGEVITYHDVLHGLRVGRGTGTKSIKARLLHQIMEMREEVLYEVLLELRKAHKVLERKLFLEIIITYGVGLRTEHLLRRYC